MTLSAYGLQRFARTRHMRVGQDGKPATDVVAAMKDRGMGALEEYAESVPHGAAKDGVQALYRGAAMPMGGARLKDRIRRTISLAFLCPTLVKAAIEGRLPRGFGVKRLMDLPMAWPDQWSALGLRAPAER